MDLNQIFFVIILSVSIIIMYAVRAVCSKNEANEEAFRDIYASDDSDSEAAPSEEDEPASEGSDWDDDEEFDDSD
jgi:hypothetical protein